MKGIGLILILVLNATTYTSAFIRPSIRNIISNNAIITTLFKEVNRELLDKSSIITELNNIEGPNINQNINDSLIGIPFYSLMLFGSIMYETKNINNTSNIDKINKTNKIQNTDVYKKYSTNTRTLLLIIILVFNRHIENAI